MEILCLILAIITLVFAYSTIYYQDRLNSAIKVKEELVNQKNFWRSQENKKSIEILEHKESIKMLKVKLDKSYQRENEMRDEIILLQKENEDLKNKRKRKKETKNKLPKRPGIRADRDKKIKYTKDYLKASGIKFREINRTNAFLEICETPFKIYASTQAFVNNETKVKSYGVMTLVKLVKEYKNKEKDNNE